MRKKGAALIKMASGNGRCFQIKQILARRHKKQKYYYKVRWEGYSPADDTWEPRKHLPQHIYRAFDEKFTCECKKAEATDSSVATASTEVCTLFIGHPNNTTSEGNVKCKVENKKFCYVDLADVDDLDKAISLSGGDIDGATAIIENARPKNDTSKARTPNTPQGGKDSSVLDMDTDTEDSGNGDQDETELTKSLSISFSSRELREKLHSLGRLTDIWEGRVKTDRHSKYMLGGMERRCLDQNVPLHFLNEDQEAVVMETLLSMFQEKFVHDKAVIRCLFKRL